MCDPKVTPEEINPLQLELQTLTASSKDLGYSERGLLKLGPQVLILLPLHILLILISLLEAKGKRFAGVSTVRNNIRLYDIIISSPLRLHAVPGAEGQKKPLTLSVIHGAAGGGSARRLPHAELGTRPGRPIIALRYPPMAL
ncbi:hypothetical protein FQA47_015792 [Oryzias melastigma]|uniref:Uncharacterized protein n=1 Tax=Oryzias melastigma TaxID=30732 RepID=A0A834F5X9_ORYME|nr:hypothetical protein FQA47_015792 [Oryzias melastigma]